MVRMPNNKDFLLSGQQYSSNHLGKIPRLVLLFSLVLASISVFYYLVILPTHRERELNTQRQTLQSQLQSCLVNAENTWGLQHKRISDYAKISCGPNDPGCDSAIVDEYNINDKQLQTDKGNCFRQYPQK